MPHLHEKNIFWFRLKKIHGPIVLNFAVRSNVNHHKKSRRSKGFDLPSKYDTSFKCEGCSEIVDRKRQDEYCCGEHVCHICKEYVLSDHLCYMQPYMQPTFHLRHLVTNLYFTTLRRIFPHGSMWWILLLLHISMVQNFSLRATMLL